jgi:hypothetical protein
MTDTTMTRRRLHGRVNLDALRVRVRIAARELLAAGQRVSPDNLRKRGVTGSTTNLLACRRALVAAGELPPEAEVFRERRRPTVPSLPPAPLRPAPPAAGDEPPPTSTQESSALYHAAWRRIFRRRAVAICVLLVASIAVASQCSAQQPTPTITITDANGSHLATLDPLSKQWNTAILPSAPMGPLATAVNGIAVASPIYLIGTAQYRYAVLVVRQDDGSYQGRVYRSWYRLGPNAIGWEYEYAPFSFSSPDPTVNGVPQISSGNAYPVNPLAPAFTAQIVRLVPGPVDPFGGLDVTITTP